MGVPTRYSEAVQQVLKLAKKTAVLLGKPADPDNDGTIPVEGWELLNALYALDRRAVEQELGPLLRERNCTIDALPWVDPSGIEDSALEGKRFRVVRRGTEDYLARASRRARGGVLELAHILEALAVDLPEMVISRMPRIPEFQGVRDFLRSRILGQDACIDAVIEGLKVSRLRLDEGKPYSFALLGPTGVGKTELVKQLARFVCGEKHLARRFLCINLSRYQMETAHELIFGGSPWKGQPGEGLLHPFFSQISTKIPGSGHELQVTEPCIVLLDEIDKAHYSTFMAFLRMLDEGVVEVIHQQAHYRYRLGKQTLLFLTSNAGSSLYEDESIGARFLQNPQIIKEALQQEAQWNTQHEGDGLRSSGGFYGFRPEFLSRIDTFVMFSKLQPSHMESITELNLRELGERIRSHETFKHIESIEFDPALPTLLAFKDGFQYGVRNLKALIESTFIPPIISFADEHPVDGVKRLEITIGDDQFREQMFLKPWEVKVLAIDDPTDLADPDDYRNHFKDLQFKWDSASSLVGALELLKENRYTFVLMDLHLDILYQIRRRFPSVPVFIFSETASEEELRRVMLSGGARDFLRKDLDENEIQRQLRLFEQLARDHNRTAHLRASLAGQANGLSFRVDGPVQENDTLHLRITQIQPVYTPRTDDLGIYTQKRAAVPLADVQGIEAVRPQVEELIAILKNPKDYQALGASLPKGLLLWGPPGTGKTMLAQAVAYETGLPFFYTSSSIIAGRVAELGMGALTSFFSQVRRNSPCVVFIDEIDGMGHRRSGLDPSIMLHGLLTGIDNIRPHEQVLFIAATNRPEILDPALTRAGRFDRKLAMEPPNAEGRQAILAKLQTSYDTADLDLKRLSRLTFGFTGAELASLFNEGALAARRKGCNTISQEIMEEVLDLVRFGPETGALKHPEERRQLAVHELGHGLLTTVFRPGALNRVSIISRSHHLGISQSLPLETFERKSRRYWFHELAICLGGRVAEEIVYGDTEGQTPGVESDFEKATRLATAMVCQWGMTKSLKGMLAFERQSYLGQVEKTRLFFSEQTAREIDQAVQQLLAEAEELARITLNPLQSLLGEWADTLVELEEISGEEVMNMLEKAKAATG